MSNHFKLMSSLEECFRDKDLYDTIKLEISYGKDFFGFHYTTLGFANLLAAEVGAVILSSSGREKKIIVGFYSNRLFFLTRKLSYWYDRSVFGIPSFHELFSRARHPNKRYDQTESYINIKKK